MNLYEKIFIIDPNLDETAADNTIEKIKDVIVKQGGEILKTDKWGRRKLAYELNGYEKGNYVLLLFKAPSSTVAELERICRVTDAIIKFMVVKLIKKAQKDAALAALDAGEKKEQTGSASGADGDAAPKPASAEEGGAEGVQ